MAKQTINIGASPNDGTGTPLRTSFDYTNQNFTEIYTALGGGVALPGATTQVIFNDGGTNLAGDAGLVYNKTTDALTVAGLVTAGSATITGDLTVDTSTLKVDSTNNRVGIGTATPTQALHVRGNILTGSAAGTDSFLNVTTDGVQNSYFGFNNSGSTNASGASNNNTYIGSGNNYPVQIVSNGALVATFSSTTVRIANNNIVMATSGTGIDFSATANGSGTMTSELLADYEEGTWDAAFGTGGGTVTISAAENNCRYTKIGRVVTVNGYISVSSVSSPTGALTITNLPFQIAAGSEANAYSAAAVAANGLETTATGQIVGYGVANTTTISLLRYESGNQVNLASGVKANSVFIFSLTYSV
jgi:hypothetical protein